MVKIPVALIFKLGLQLLQDVDDPIVVRSSILLVS